MVTALECKTLRGSENIMIWPPLLNKARSENSLAFSHHEGTFSFFLVSSCRNCTRRFNLRQLDSLCKEVSQCDLAL